MKKNTLSAILMTLFLFISCNSSGSEGSIPGTGEAGVGTNEQKQEKKLSKSIDLKLVGEKVSKISLFMIGVKEVDVLVKAINGLAKAIGKSVQTNGSLHTAGDQNGSLIAGAYQIMVDIDTKLGVLKTNAEISDEIKKKVDAANEGSKALLAQIKKVADTDFKKAGVTDNDAKKAIDITNNNQAGGEKGGVELVALNAAVKDLVETTKKVLDATIGELTSPVDKAK